MSLPSRLSHLLSPNLDDGSDRQSQEEDFTEKLDNLPEKNGIAPIPSHRLTASLSTTCKFPHSASARLRRRRRVPRRPRRHRRRQRAGTGAHDCIETQEERRGPVGTTTTPSTAPRRAACSAPAATIGPRGDRPSGERSCSSGVIRPGECPAEDGSKSQAHDSPDFAPPRLVHGQHPELRNPRPLRARQLRNRRRRRSVFIISSFVRRIVDPSTRGEATDTVRNTGTPERPRRRPTPS